MDEIVTDLRILKQISSITTREEVERLNLKERIKTALTGAWTKGCGLAAIQIGVPLRFAWFVFDSREYELINPVIITRIGWHEDEEGCLAKGLKARIIQHEIDHMDGILNTDE